MLKSFYLNCVDCSLLRRWAIVFIFIVFLSTIFVIDSSVWQGEITANYFWFAAVICASILFIPIRFSEKWKIVFTDILSSILALSVCFNWLHLYAYPDMHWWLSLLMIPLYVIARTVIENEELKRFFCFHIGNCTGRQNLLLV